MSLSCISGEEVKVSDNLCGRSLFLTKFKTNLVKELRLSFQSKTKEMISILEIRFTPGFTEREKSRLRKFAEDEFGRSKLNLVISFGKTKNGGYRVNISEFRLKPLRYT